MTDQYISNREFDRAERTALEELSSEIRESGMSYNQIARGTRLERRAVSRAAKGLGIRFSAYVRIRYYLQKAKSQQQ